MVPRKFACLCLATLGLWLQCSLGNAVESTQPNVLFIAVDDLNDWIGCLGGHPQAKTPIIDSLAARGVLFTNAHCAAPACNPSRAAIFSGQMPTKTKVWSNDSKQLLALHPEIMTLPKAFRQAGYLTLGTGKLLHGGKDNSKLFERSLTVDQRWSPLSSELVRYTDQELPTKATSQPHHLVQRAGLTDLILPLNGMPSDRSSTSPDGESFDWGPIEAPDSSMGDSQCTDWAIEQLHHGFNGTPFFMGVGYYRPHIPLWAPAKYFEPFPIDDIQLPQYTQDDLDDLSETGKRWALEAVTAGSHATVVAHDQWRQAIQAYLACTYYVDHEIGRLLQALEVSGLAGNTIIVLWTDHGWHLGEKEHWGKWTGWERSTRVPLIISVPENTQHTLAKPGSRCHQPASLLDLFPTLGELCDIPVPNELDGVSLVPLLREPTQETGRTVTTLFDQGNVSVRNARYRYIRYADGTEELYDHTIDPNEWHNLSADPSYLSALENLRPAHD